MRLWISSLPEKIEAGERVASLAFGHFEMRPALRAALPSEASVEFGAAEIKISISCRRPLILARERRGRKGWGRIYWKMGKQRGDGLLCGLAKLQRLPVPMMADRLLDAAGWRQ